MLGVLAGFFVVWCIILVGMFVGRRGILGENARSVLSALTFFVASPALLFDTLSKANVRDIFAAPLLVAAVGAADVPVAIAGLDTRKLTRLLRDRGAQNGCVAAGEGIDVDKAVEAARKFPGLNGMDLAREVCTRERYSWTEGELDLDSNQFRRGDARFHVVAYDFGVKRNILRMLAERGCRVTVVPAQTPAAQVLAEKPDGVFLSNGPGDPAPCDYAIAAIREILAARIPVFGICLGHQLLGLAAGASTLKMKFGHHGANHPVIDLASKRVMITSQNHGFAVDEATLPANVRVTHRSLFDGSNQGIELTDAPAFSFQGHPEASPGPRDVAGLFDKFMTMMASRH